MTHHKETNESHMLAVASVEPSSSNKTCERCLESDLIIGDDTVCQHCILKDLNQLAHEIFPDATKSNQF